MSKKITKTVEPFRKGRAITADHLNRLAGVISPGPRGIQAPGFNTRHEYREYSRTYTTVTSGSVEFDQIDSVHFRDQHGNTLVLFFNNPEPPP